MSERSVPQATQQGVPPQHAGGPAQEPLREPETATGDGRGAPETIRQEMRRALIVFGALAILTLITVAISRLSLPGWQAVALALVVAAIKATLIAAFFMHLLSERRLIYALLLFTLFLLGMLLWGPWHHRLNAQKVYKGYDLNASQPSATATQSPRQQGR